MSSMPAPLRVAKALDWRGVRRALQLHWTLVIGIAALAIPTLVSVAREIWSTEDGAHGPIVLASGAWLLVRLWPEMVKSARPPPLMLALMWMVPALAIYVLGRIVGVLGVEMFGLMISLYGVVFALGGTQALRALWFPLVYLAFLIPLPDTVVAILTQPLKLGISEAATKFLYALGYPVANTGVTLQVGSYQLLVATACSGLNAIISLSAIGLFYVYLLHRTSWRYAIVLLLFVLPCAIFANFVRVVTLILLTYYGGDAVAQGFLHNLAGMLTFGLAVIAIFAVDHLLAPLRPKLRERDESRS